MDSSTFRAMLLLTVVFVAGGVVGVAADRLDLLAGTVTADEPAATEPAETEDRDRERRGNQTTIEAFADDLGLTADQRATIEGYLDRYRVGARMLQRDVRPRYRALMDSVRTEIESVLTAEQVEAYRELLRQRYGGGRERDREPERSDDPDGPDDNDQPDT